MSGSHHDVEVTLLTTAPELRAGEGLLRAVWGAGPGEDAPFQFDMMRALAHTGGYVAGARLDGELVGVAGGFRAVNGSLHSHVAGVLPGAQGKGVGLALKLHQRSWAAEQGFPSVSWTYDPLIRRNAWFNLGRLGAKAVEYLPEFYGEIRDSINAGDLTDRLYVDWTTAVAEPSTGAGKSSRVGGRAQVPLDAFDPVLSVEESTGRCHATSRSPDTWSDRVRCAVPPDIERLRRADPDTGRQWRQALRVALHGGMTHGFSVVGFDRAGWYLLERSPVG